MKRVITSAIAMAILLIVGASYARSPYDATGPATEGTLVELADRVGTSPKAITIIDYAHAKKHAGLAYTIFSYATVTASNTYSYLFTTPATTEMHFSYTIMSSATTTVALFTGPNAAGGTTVTPTADNQTSTNTTSMVVTSLPTITTNGTAIANHYISAGGLLGVGDIATDEMVLAHSTKYLLLVTTGTATSNVDFTIKWYEN
jgi:hypothetical protein